MVSGSGVAAIGAATRRGVEARGVRGGEEIGPAASTATPASAFSTASPSTTTHSSSSEPTSHDRPSSSYSRSARGVRGVRRSVPSCRLGGDDSRSASRSTSSRHASSDRWRRADAASACAAREAWAQCMYARVWDPGSRWDPGAHALTSRSMAVSAGPADCTERKTSASASGG